jgi:hypothetical protein
MTDAIARALALFRELLMMTALRPVGNLSNPIGGGPMTAR